MPELSSVDPRAFLFDGSAAPPRATLSPSPPDVVPWDAGGRPLSPTKALAKPGMGWEQLSQNKYMLAGGCGLATLIGLVIWTPSFAMTEDKVNFQTVLILAALAFVAVAWGPRIVAAAQSMRAPPA